MEVNEAKRMKGLEKDNTKLKKLLAERTGHEGCTIKKVPAQPVSDKWQQS